MSEARTRTRDVVLTDAVRESPVDIYLRRRRRLVLAAVVVIAVLIVVAVVVAG